MPLSKRILHQVELENMRLNQIGGETDGVSKEVGEDLGYKPYEEPSTPGYRPNNHVEPTLEGKQQMTDAEIDEFTTAVRGLKKKFGKS